MAETPRGRDSRTCGERRGAEGAGVAGIPGASAVFPSCEPLRLPAVGALVCIVPAAGESRRMGRPKQLLPFGDRTVLECVVDAALFANVGPVVVVLGHRAGDVAACLGDRPAITVVNHDYRAGMLSSVQAGVRTALPLLPCVGRRGFLFLLGDQPRIGADTVRRMACAFGTSRHGIVLPVCAGRRGHPAAYSAAYAPEILALPPDVGLREILRRHPEDVEELPLDAPGILDVLNTPQEYERLLRQEQGG